MDSKAAIQTDVERGLSKILATYSSKLGLSLTPKDGAIEIGFKQLCRTDPEKMYSVNLLIGDDGVYSVQKVPAGYVFRLDGSLVPCTDIVMIFSRGFHVISPPSTDLLIFYTKDAPPMQAGEHDAIARGRAERPERLELVRCPSSKGNLDNAVKRVWFLDSWHLFYPSDTFQRDIGHQHGRRLSPRRRKREKVRLN